MNWLYMVFLLVSLAGMAVLDARFKLFWFASPARAAIVHAVGFVVLLLWDVTGIAAGVFHRGDSALMTGVNVAPQLPVEELLFLAFLCWLTMNLYGLGARVAGRLEDGREDKRGEA